jgi:dsDNA-binding SOS-regulon protein
LNHGAGPCETGWCVLGDVQLLSPPSQSCPQHHSDLQLQSSRKKKDIAESRPETPEGSVIDASASAPLLPEPEPTRAPDTSLAGLWAQLHHCLTDSDKKRRQYERRMEATEYDTALDFVRERDGTLAAAAAALKDEQRRFLEQHRAELLETIRVTDERLNAIALTRTEAVTDAAAN